jgi:hypothetical protein
MDAVLVGLGHPSLENHSLALLRHAAGAAGFSTVTLPFGGWPDLEPVLRAVGELRPRLVGISLQNTEAALASLSLARLMRARGFAGQLVCGGHFATLNAEEILRSPAGVDVVVRFAGEAALVGLLRGEARAQLPGATWLEAGALAHGAPPALADGIPRWARPAALPQHLGFPAADLVASRGCAARCAYCCVAGASAMLQRERGDGYARPDVAHIADEMAWLWHERGARVFNFMDDNLLPLEADAAESFVRDLGDALGRRRVGRIAFSLQLRADVVSEGVADALASLGLVRAYVGVDGYSAAQLRQLGRKAPAPAGATAIDRLSERGVFCLANALLFGPTIPFAAVQAELAGLAAITRAPLHLLPIDARAGTRYFEAAQRRGLMEGGFLWRHYRFADARTALVAELVTSLPTRLIERSPPIALYDLGYNLGIAQRLAPATELDAFADGYARIAAAWNRDQLRVLAAAVGAAERGAEAVAELREREAARVRAHDEALVAECDALVVAVERAVARAAQHAVRAHARGRLLSSVALAMGVAACRTPPWSGQVIDAAAPSPGTPDLASAPAPPDLTLGADLANPCPAGRMPETEVPMCLCPYGAAVRITFDGNGVVTAVTAADGSALPAAVQMCLQDFFKSYCYPSLAGTTKEVLSSHCWVA